MDEIALEKRTLEEVEIAQSHVGKLIVPVSLYGGTLKDLKELQDLYKIPMEALIKEAIDFWLCFHSSLDAQEIRDRLSERIKRMAADLRAKGEAERSIELWKIKYKERVVSAKKEKVLKRRVKSRLRELMMNELKEDKEKEGPI